MHDFTTTTDTSSGNSAAASAEYVSVSPGSGPFPGLQELERQGRQAEERARGIRMTAWADDLSHLADSRREGWRSVLAAAASAEGLEASVVESLLAAKKMDAEASEYLLVHAADERRHGELLKSYLRNTFSFEQKGRGVANPLFAILRLRPLYGLALLHCVEKFTGGVLGHLRARAQADGAQNLLTLLQAIQKDELRQGVAISYLLTRHVRSERGLVAGELTAIKVVLGFFVRRYARTHWQALGLDTEQLTGQASRSLEATIGLMNRC